jgi:hypothetical protein
MTKTPDDITKFIAMLQAKLANLPEQERQQMIQIIKDLIKLAKNGDRSSKNGSDQIH